MVIFCMTATLFLIRPTSSQTASQYDPWLDTNGDGKIDIRDIAVVAKAFGTAGDPTKDVNVTNWPIDPAYQTQSTSLLCTFTIPVNVSGHYYYYNYTISPIIYVGGYSHIWIYLTPPMPNETSQYTLANYGVDQYVTSVDWLANPTSYYSAHEANPNIESVTEANVSISHSPPMYASHISIWDNPIETKSPYLRFTVYSYTSTDDDPGSMVMTATIYLRNN